MADLPEPKSRKEEYLATAAGMTGIELPEPASREEIYLDAIAQGGGGGGGSSYTAGDGIDITNNEISVDTETIQPKLTAGTNITIDEDNVISAEGGGPTVVQTTGTSTTDVMSQKATTNMVYANPNQPTSPNRSVSLGGAFAPLTLNNIGIGYRANPGGSSNAQYNICLGADSTAQSGSYGIVIGNSAYIGKNYAISIGASCGGTEVNGVSIGYRSHAVGKNAVAIGSNSIANENGQFDISSSFQGSTTGGYNNTQYRLLTGLYDPQNAHDAATKGYVDTKLGNLTLVSISQTDYDALATKDPNTLYIITGA